MSSSEPLSRRAVLAIVLDLIGDELSRSRRRSVLALGRRDWSEATRVGGPELDLDSLDRINVASALNEFFHLHEHGAEDYLLALPSIGEWCDLVQQSLAATGTHLTFRTSGSTGEPKRCVHAIADLRQEAQGWADRFPDVTAIAAMVPAHHIYGTIFAALLPDRIGPECAVEQAAGADTVRRAGPGTLVVGTPTHWQYLAPALPDFPPGLTGVTSTAPMAAGLGHRLRGQGLDRLVEVYGSSETAGIAMREHGSAAFALLDGWSGGGWSGGGWSGGGWSGEGDGLLRRVRADGCVQAVLPPDHLRWLDERQFTVQGRRDGAVQVGGRNVFPARVRDELLAHAGVAEAAVRLEPETGRLKAFVVPVVLGDDPDRLVQELDRWCGDRLSTAERPRRFTLGDALPANAMGKLADW